MPEGSPLTAPGHAFRWRRRDWLQVISCKQRPITASYGGLTRGPRLVTKQTREQMRAILEEIRSGSFGDEWLAECHAGKKRLTGLEEAEARHPSEAAGAAVREIAKKALPQ